jgi:protocatechuate 3,4-dioxygenase beta subunit
MKNKIILTVLFCNLSFLGFAQDIIKQTPINLHRDYSKKIENQDKDEIKNLQEPRIFVQSVKDKDFRIFNPLRPTPERLFKASSSRPSTFSTTNNLAKKPGSFYRAFGEVIFLQGTVRDSFGVPIEGAIIEIWQTNAAGKYHSLLDKDSEYIDKHFSMSGKAITDNLGNYNFITIMPGGAPGRSAHINMDIYSTQFGKLETEVYFQDHPFNNTDYQYLSYKEDDRKSLTAKVKHSDILNTRSIKICTFDIIMPGIHQYKGF